MLDAPVDWLRIEVVLDVPVDRLRIQILLGFLRGQLHIQIVLGDMDGYLHVYYMLVSLLSFWFPIMLHLTFFLPCMCERSCTRGL